MSVDSSSPSSDDTGRVAVITFPHPLDQDVFAERVERGTSAAISSGYRYVLIDLCEAPHILLAIEVASLAAAQKRLRSLGGCLAILRPSAKIREAFQSNWLEKVFPLYDDEATARAQIKTHGQSPTT
jgi:anti-anti-sigma regulatory factor